MALTIHKEDERQATTPAVLADIDTKGLDSAGNGPLSTDQIAGLRSFFDLLAKWDEEEKRMEAKFHLQLVLENGKPPIGGTGELLSGEPGGPPKPAHLIYIIRKGGTEYASIGQRRRPF